MDLIKDSRRKPSELVFDLELSEDAVALLPDSPNAFAYLGVLCEHVLLHDAFLLLARTLPKQYAIIWATQCVDQYMSDALAPEDKQCAELVRRWLKGPDEKIRRAAAEAAETAEYEGPWAWLAAAVGFSGGSLAPENLPVVAPADNLTAVAVAAGLTGLTMKDPETSAELGKQMIDRGLAMVAIPGS
jgi:hypothetical protein